MIQNTRWGILTRLDLIVYNSRDSLEKPHLDEQRWVGLFRNLGMEEPLTVRGGNLFP